MKKLRVDLLVEWLIRMEVFLSLEILKSIKNKIVLIGREFLD